MFDDEKTQNYGMGFFEGNHAEVPVYTSEPVLPFL
jgi:hypothetical protein